MEESPATLDIVDVIPGAVLVKAKNIRKGDFTFNAFGQPYEVSRIWPGKEYVSIGHYGWSGSSARFHREAEVAVITAETMAAQRAE